MASSESARQILAALTASGVPLAALWARQVHGMVILRMPDGASLLVCPEAQGVPRSDRSWWSVRKRWPDGVPVAHPMHHGFRLSKAAKVVALYLRAAAPDGVVETDALMDSEHVFMAALFEHGAWYDPFDVRLRADHISPHDRWSVVYRLAQLGAEGGEPDEFLAFLGERLIDLRPAHGVALAGSARALHGPTAPRCGSTARPATSWNWPVHGRPTGTAPPRKD